MANGVRASALYRVRASDPPVTLLPDYCFAQALVRFGFLLETPHDSAALRVRPLWQILGDVGLPVALIGWPLTHPAPQVNGVVVSEAFHLLTDAELELEDTAAVSPRELLPILRGAMALPASLDPVALVSRIARTPDGDVDPLHDPAPIVADRTHLQVLRAVAARDARLNAPPGTGGDCG